MNAEYLNILLIETLKRCFYSICFHSFAVVSHLGKFTDLIRLLEDFSGRISIDANFIVMFQRNSNMYSFYYFGATECAHQNSNPL